MEDRDGWQSHLVTRPRNWEMYPEGVTVHPISLSVKCILDYIAYSNLPYEAVY